MRSGALWITFGIFLSRLAGLVRERVLAHFLGAGEVTDALRVAIRIPNLLQNLLGEGVLSGSFVPFYSRLVEKEDVKKSQDLAWAVLWWLTLVAGVIAGVGVEFAAELVSLIAPGLEGGGRVLAIELVQIIFPGTAVLVVSAWCLGVLNSHRKFLLPYAAPVLWNLAIIGSCVIFGNPLRLEHSARVVAWGLVGGGVLQTLVQLPLVLKLLGGVSLTLGQRVSEVRSVFVQFLPIVGSRGVVQISAYLDTIWGSLLAVGTIANLSYAQAIYLLPVSLFGMAISTSELTEMSRGQNIASRLSRGFARLRFLIAPSTVVMLLLGDVLVSGLYQTGAFRSENVPGVAALLGAYSLGLLATTQSRLLSSAYYASEMPKIPFMTSLARVLFSAVMGLLVVVTYRHDALQMWTVQFPLLQEWSERTGGAAMWLALGSSIASWIELGILSQRSPSIWWEDKRDLGPEKDAAWRPWLSSILAGTCCWLLKSVVGALHPALKMMIICFLFSLLYLLISAKLQPQGIKLVSLAIRNRREGVGKGS